VPKPHNGLVIEAIQDRLHSPRGLVKPGDLTGLSLTIAGCSPVSGQGPPKAAVQPNRFERTFDRAIEP